MRIWEVTTNTEMVRFYFFPTKKEADAFAREQRRELRDEGYDLTADTISVDSWNVEPNGAGIAKALNDLVSVTCLNEG